MFLKTQKGKDSMRRRFNITGSCKPQRHYMVRLDDRIKKIKEDYVDESSYFVINRGRQYGKTTTLEALEDYLKEEYIVISLDFQLIYLDILFLFHQYVSVLMKKLLEVTVLTI